jgi:DNA-binding transcriptional LysR family regulator
VKALTLEGLGMAYLPDFVIDEELSLGTLLRVLPNHTGPTLGVHAVHPYGRHLPIGARKFIEILDQVLKFSD